MGPGTLGKNLKFFAATALAAVFCGLATVKAAPMLTKNVKILLGLPVVGLLFIVMVLNFHWMFMALIGTRALMDPVLNMTKIGGGGGAGLGALLNLLVIALIAVMVLRVPGAFKGLRPVWAPWVLFLAWVGLTAFYSPVPKQAIRLLINFMTYTSVFLTPFVLAADDKEQRFWYRWLLAASFLPVLVADAGLVTHQRLLYSGGRLNGTFSHANILGFYLLYVIALSLYVWRTGKIRMTTTRRILLFFHILNCMGLIVFTQARSAWIACAILVLLFGLMRDRRILLLCILGGCVLLATPPVRARLDDLRHGTGQRRTEQLNSAAWRFKLWKAAWPEIRKRPLVGHGLGSFQYLSPTFFQQTGSQTAPAHNIYVELLFETGIFGCLGYLGVFFAVFRRIWPNLRVRGPGGDGAAILFAYLFGYLIVSFTDNTLYYLSMNWYLWFFTGLYLACERAQ